MKAQELWNKYTTDSSLTYEAWAFGDDPDGLAQLVVDGIKTATSSAYIFYELENEKIPKVGEYSVILNSKEEAIYSLNNGEIQSIVIISSENSNSNLKSIYRFKVKKDKTNKDIY